MGGGNFSTGDTPFPTVTGVFDLQEGDVMSFYMFTMVANVSLGGVNHWFRVESYLIGAPGVVTVDDS